jgi:hypothetical protein
MESAAVMERVAKVSARDGTPVLQSVAVWTVSNIEYVNIFIKQNDYVLYPYFSTQLYFSFIHIRKAVHFLHFEYAFVPPNTTDITRKVNIRK